MAYDLFGNGRTALKAYYGRFYNQFGSQLAEAANYLNAHYAGLTIEEVRGRDIPAVFCESTVSGAAMEQVAAETGSRLAGMLYVDSLSTPSGPVPTYLDLLDHNLETITRELAS